MYKTNNRILNQIIDRDKLFLHHKPRTEKVVCLRIWCYASANDFGIW